MKYRLLNRFERVTDYRDIPTDGTFVVLTKSKTFLGKAIQGFQRLHQWRRGIRDTELIPNHADGVKNGYGIGALSLGVQLRPFASHFGNKEAQYYIVRPQFNEEQEEKFWQFMIEQVAEPYRYTDLFRYIVRSFKIRWPGKEEELDRDKWTCYTLVASALNYAYDEVIFPNPYQISPYECAVIFDKRKDLFS